MRVVGVEAVQALPYEVLDLAPLVCAGVQVPLHRRDCSRGVARRRRTAIAAAAEQRLQLPQRFELPGLLLQLESVQSCVRKFAHCRVSSGHGMVNIFGPLLLPHASWAFPSQITDDDLLPGRHPTSHVAPREGLTAG